MLNKPIFGKKNKKGKTLNTGRMKIKMRLTPSGCGFLALIACGFLMSVNFSNNLIFAMTFLLVSIAMVGWYHTYVNVKNMGLGDWKTSPVFAGQKAVYRLAVKNKSKHRRHGLQPVCEKSDTDTEVHLSGNEQVEMILKRQTDSRGILEPVPADICSSFPLGIFKARLGSGALPGCLVYPIPKGGQALPDHPSGKDAHMAAESGTFTDMRRYAPGDPLSRISWKAFARFDELYTKEFDGAQGKPALWLRWDDVSAQGVEDKLSQLCQWVLDAHKKGREYGLEIPGTSIDPACEESHLKECLKTLAFYGKSQEVT